MVPQPFPHLDGSGWVRIELRVVAQYLAAEAPEHVPGVRATDLIPEIRHRLLGDLADLLGDLARGEGPVRVEIAGGGAP